MRLIKENTAEYESFHKSLQYFTKNSESRGELKLLSFESHRTNSNLLEKYSFFVQNISKFQNKIRTAETLQEINFLFQDFVKRVLFAKDAEIFFFSDGSKNILPVNANLNQNHYSAVVKAYKNGILDWVFETKKATIIPDFSSPALSPTKLNQIIFPLYDKKINYGLLSIITPLTKISDESLEYQSIQILLGIVVPVISSLKQKQSINKLYNELQSYQSKINNDFDIYALGEMTEGILENILEPLQVILSLADMIENEKQADKEIAVNIKQQVKKVSEVATRLGKFVSLNKPQTAKNQPCDLNKIIKEFKNVINSTLQNIGLECELDLEENIPPVLSDPKDLKQILTSVFSVIKSGAKNGGAVIIQTKYLKERNVLSVFTTEHIPSLANQPEFKSNVTVKLINDLMKKNQGTAEFNSLPLKGTIIHLIFPLKRNMSL